MLIISEINNNNNFKITIFTPSFFSVHIVTTKESNFCHYKICLVKRKWLIFNSILHLQQFLIMSYTIYFIKIILKQNLKRINLIFFSIQEMLPKASRELSQPPFPSNPSWRTKWSKKKYLTWSQKIFQRS